MTPDKSRRNAGTRTGLVALAAAAAILIFAGCESGQIAAPVTTGVQWARITDPESVPFPVYPSWRGDSIVFQFQNPLNRSHLAVTASNGTGARSLPGTSLSDNEITPRWLDDSTVVYTSQQSGSYDLWYRTTTGATVRRLTALSSGEWDPVPRPGGPGLLYIGGPQQVRGQLTLIPDTAAVPMEFIFLSPDSVGQPDWDASGGRICYSAGDAAGTYRHIFVINLSAGDSIPVQVTTGPFNDQWPHFSPDGTRILFASNRTGRQGLWWVSPSGEAEGLEVIAFADAGATLLTPSYSPDGSKIVVSANMRGLGFSLWLLSNLP